MSLSDDQSEYLRDYIWDKYAHIIKPVGSVALMGIGAISLLNPVLSAMLVVFSRLGYMASKDALKDLDIAQEQKLIREISENHVDEGSTFDTAKKIYVSDVAREEFRKLINFQKPFKLGLLKAEYGKTLCITEVIPPFKIEPNLIEFNNINELLYNPEKSEFLMKTYGIQGVVTFRQGGSSSMYVNKQERMMFPNISMGAKSPSDYINFSISSQSIFAWTRLCPEIYLPVNEDLNFFKLSGPEKVLEFIGNGYKWQNRGFS